MDAQNEGDGTSVAAGYTLSVGAEAVDLFDTLRRTTPLAVVQCGV
jgi:hypothetical protein